MKNLISTLILGAGLVLGLNGNISGQVNLFENSNTYWHYNKINYIMRYANSNKPDTTISDENTIIRKFYTKKGIGITYTKKIDNRNFEITRQIFNKKNKLIYENFSKL